MFRTIVWIVAALAVTITASLWYGARSWDDHTTQLRNRLAAAHQAPAHERFDPDQLTDLPAPVQRYLRTVLPAGQPLIRRVQLRQEGDFNLGQGRPRWVPFTADQLSVVQRPGFDWNARIRVAPGVQAFVHDAYVNGEGILHAALFGLLTVADVRGTTEIAHGELMRFLAETPWYPTALLPGQGVTWEPIDNHAARATLRDADTTVTLVFHFNDHGLVDSVSTDARHRSVGDTLVPTPWEGRFSDYALRDGMRVPHRGEVAWLLPDGRSPYWRGTLVDIRYDTTSPLESWAQ